jgi:hypothetical protein
MTEEYVLGSSSASRQKSCYACVKGKRGCDKRQPICSRCEEKKIQCLYAKRTYSEAFYGFNSTDLELSWEELTSVSSSTNFVDDVSLNRPPSDCLDPFYPSALDAFIGPFPEFSNNPIISTDNSRLINNSSERPGQQLEKEEALSEFDYAPMADLCVCKSNVK